MQIKRKARIKAWTKMKGCKKKQTNIGKGEIRFDEERKSVFDILK